MEDVDEPDDDEGDPNDITALAGIDVEVWQRVLYTALWYGKRKRGTVLVM